MTARKTAEVNLDQAEIETLSSLSIFFDECTAHKGGKDLVPDKNESFQETEG